MYLLSYNYKQQVILLVDNIVKKNRYVELTALEGDQTSARVWHFCNVLGRDLSINLADIYHN